MTDPSEHYDNSKLTLADLVGDAKLALEGTEPYKSTMEKRVAAGDQLAIKAISIAKGQPMTEEKDTIPADKSTATGKSESDVEQLKPPTMPTQPVNPQVIDASVQEQVEKATGQSWENWAATRPALAAVISEIKVRERLATLMRTTPAYTSAVAGYTASNDINVLYDKLLGLADVLIPTVLGL